MADVAIGNKMLWRIGCLLSGVMGYSLFVGSWLNSDLSYLGMACKWPAGDAFWARARSLQDRCPPENVGTGLGNSGGETRPQIHQSKGPKDIPAPEGPHAVGSDRKGNQLCVKGKNQALTILELGPLDQSLKLNALAGGEGQRFP